jgi:hypothetical protein
MINKELQQKYKKSYRKLRDDPIRWRKFLDKLKLKYHKNIIIRREKERAYYAANRERIIKRKIRNTKKWKKNNPEKAKYQTYKGGAHTRHFKFDLSKEQFLSLIRDSCYYCGNKNNNGIDRVNSSEGYNIINTVTCCTMCNRMKATHSQKDFLEKCKQIATRHR